MKWNFIDKFKKSINIIIFIICVLLFINSSYAQGNIADSLGSFSSTENIDIESDHLVIDQEAKITTFTGNVIAIQEDIQINADKMVVLYENNEEEKKADKNNNNEDEEKDDIAFFKSDEVEFIEYYGNVVITTESQVIKGDWAKIELNNDMLFVGDEATVDNEDSHLKGGILEVNYETKISKYRKDKKGKRIRTIIKKNDDKEKKEDKNNN